MSNLSTTLPLKKLSIWKTLREAFEVSWQNWFAFLPWLVMWVIVQGLGGYLIENSILDIEIVRKKSAASSEWLRFFFMALLFWIVQIIVFVFFAVWWHRKVLLGHGEGGNSNFFSFSERETKFFGYVFGVGCIATLVMLPGIGIMGFLLVVSDQIRQLFEEQHWVGTLFEFLFLYVPSMYFLGKYCLIFPATAVDFSPIKEWSWPANLSWSGEQVKGNEWQLAILAGVLPVIFEWISKAILLVLEIDQGAFITSIVFSLLWFPLIPIEIAVISIAFRDLTSWVPSSADKKV